MASFSLFAARRMGKSDIQRIYMEHIKEKIMNERIKELAREAGLLVHNPEGVPTKLEKFADLIVRECAQIAEISASMNRVWIGGDILEHFGVKE